MTQQVIAFSNNAKPYTERMNIMILGGTIGAVILLYGVYIPLAEISLGWVAGEFGLVLPKISGVLAGIHWAVYVIAAALVVSLLVIKERWIHPSRAIWVNTIAAAGLLLLGLFFALMLTMPIVRMLESIA